MYVIFNIIKATKKLWKHGHCHDSQPTQGNYIAVQDGLALTIS